MSLTLKCPKCSWIGNLSESIAQDDGYLCPSCKDSKVETIQEAAEDVHDVEGAVSMAHDHGERFRGYYLFKTFKETQTLPLGFADITNLTYRFSVCKFEVRFVMPSKLEFIGGILSYTDSERELGVFRFPRALDGSFSSPVVIPKDQQNISTLTEEDVAKLLRAPKPLVFDAFKIPRFNFEYLDITPFNVQEIEQITNVDHARILKAEYDKNFNKLLEDIKTKITSAPNFLLILENTLNQFWKNLNEVAVATSGIIHI